MKSFTQLRTDYGVDTKNTSSANLTYGSTVMNDFYRQLLAKADWPFLHRLRNATTVASTPFVTLPWDVDVVESIFVTVSSKRYTPRSVSARTFWDQLHFTTQTSDIPRYWFIYEDKDAAKTAGGGIGIWPRPASSGNSISINCKVRVPDLNIADITSTTITSITNGANSMIVNSGLTTQMAGMWIRPTFTTTANTGDGEWYEIASVESATACTLVRNYGGATISAGTAACTISQMPLLPEAFHLLPELYGAYRYWAKEKDERATFFKNELESGVADLFKAYGLNDLSCVIDDGEEKTSINPNLTISL